MTGNNKYQPAPQRDSFEGQSYTDAPPSYQADDQAALLGPEGVAASRDAIPDDFKVRIPYVVVEKRKLTTL
jgi:hypothetical protein